MGKIVNFDLDFTFFEKIIYNVTLSVSYFFGYIMILPHFLINGSFKKPSLSFNQTESFKESNGDTVYIPKVAKNKMTVGFKHFKSVPEIIKYYSEKFGDKPYLGTRPIIRKNEFHDDKLNKIIVTYELGDYVWKTYKKVYNIIECMALGLQEQGLGSSSEDKLIMFCDTREEWLITVVSAMLLKVTVVTIFSSLDNDSVVHAANLVEAKYILVDEKALDRIIKLESKLKFLQKIIVCSRQEINLQAITSSITIIPYEKVVEMGQNIMESSPTQLTRFSDFPDAEDIALIIFTSGSTGTPKGVVIKQKNILTQIGSIRYNEKYWLNHIYCAFLPLAHIMELTIEIGITSFGGQLGYASPLTLTDKSPMIIPGTRGDLSALKPTISVFVPLLIDRLSKAVIGFLKTQSRLKKFLFQFAYTYKSHFVEMGYDSPIINLIFFKKIQSMLGGHLRFVLSGGAILPKELENFSMVAFCTRVYQGYGLTETCAGGAAFNFDYPVYGSIGAPNTSIQLKLKAWEDGYYFPSDKPNPRGEVLLCGSSVAVGYYKQPDLTKEAFVVDPKTHKTWFHTGDIGEILPNGTLVLIDRKKDIVKLLHGEYIPLTKVEQAITSSSYVDLCAAIPSSDYSHLVSIILPSRDKIKSMLSTLNLNLTDYKNFNEILKLKEVTDLIIKDILECVKTNKLTKYEIPSSYHIVTDLWTPESNLVTPTLKLRRTEIAKFYKHFLEN